MLCSDRQLFFRLKLVEEANSLFDIINEAIKMEDYSYAGALYVKTMKPLLSNLDAWDENDALAKFRSYYSLDEIEIITLDGRDIGFLQVARSEQGISRDQIHIEAAYCSRGMGTALIQDLLREALANNNPVTLSLVKHNSARALYERLGFRVVGEDETRKHMRCEPYS